MKNVKANPKPRKMSGFMVDITKPDANASK